MGLSAGPTRGMANPNNQHPSPRCPIAVDVGADHNQFAQPGGGQPAAIWMIGEALARHPKRLTDLHRGRQIVLGDVAGNVVKVGER